ncbi:MAG: hypothetical protein K2J70_03480, partial [Muribaculaceae bacterium]|nr:hypothetical protein [Muribaculaceae bacterium]
MKKIYGIAAFAAAMTLASCSNNDEPNVNPGNTVTDGYLAIKIANVDTRSNVGGYAYGTDDENKVSNATLVFFDDQDQLIGITTQADVKDFTAQANGGNIAATKTMVVPVTKISGKEASDCASVIVVLNSTDDIDAELAAKSNVDGVR